MSLFQELGKHLENVKSWNPLNAKTEEVFTYIDLSSVDKNRKALDLNQIQQVTSLNAPSRARQIVKKSDILVSTVRPNLNGVAFVPDVLDNATASTGYCVLRANQKTLSAQYLFYWVQTKSFINEMVSKATGANYPAVSDKIIKQSKIPLPPLAEQQKIAAILDAADSLRQKDQQLVERYTALSQSLFLEMFGDLNNNHNNFKVVTIGDVVSEVKDGPHVSPEYSEAGIPILSTRNIRPSLLVLDEMKYVSRAMYEELTRRFRPQKNDVLLTKGGTTGYAKIVDFEWDFCIWVHIAALRPKINLINPKYLEAALNSHYCYSQSQLFTKGIANKDLGLKRIVNISLLLPPISLQDKFAERIQLIEAQKQQAQRSLEKSEALFNSLLQRAFTGELTAKMAA